MDAFIERVICKVYHHATPTLDDYFSAARAHRHIPAIRTPTLFLGAADDPFLGALPLEEAAENPCTLLALTSRRVRYAAGQGHDFLGFHNSWRRMTRSSGSWGRGALCALVLGGSLEPCVALQGQARGALECRAGAGFALWMDVFCMLWLQRWPDLALLRSCRGGRVGFLTRAGFVRLHIRACVMCQSWHRCAPAGAGMWAS